MRRQRQPAAAAPLAAAVAVGHKQPRHRAPQRAVLVQAHLALKVAALQEEFDGVLLIRARAPAAREVHHRLAAHDALVDEHEAAHERRRRVGEGHVLEGRGEAEGGLGGRKGGGRHLGVDRVRRTGVHAARRRAAVLAGLQAALRTQSQGRSSKCAYGASTLGSGDSGF